MAYQLKEVASLPIYLKTRNLGCTRWYFCYFLCTRLYVPLTDSCFVAILLCTSFASACIFEMGAFAYGQSCAD